MRRQVQSRTIPMRRTWYVTFLLPFTFLSSMMSETHQPNVDVAQAMTVGRVAAASLAFSSGASPSSSQTQTRSTSSLPLPVSLASISISPSPQGKPSEPPPSLPRRTTTSNVFAPAPAPTTTASALVPGFQVDKLVTQKVGSLARVRVRVRAEVSFSSFPLVHVN